MRRRRTSWRLCRDWLRKIKKIRPKKPKKSAEPPPPKKGPNFSFRGTEPTTHRAAMPVTGLRSHTPGALIAAEMHDQNPFARFALAERCADELCQRSTSSYPLLPIAPPFDEGLLNPCIHEDGGRRRLRPLPLQRLWSVRDHHRDLCKGRRHGALPHAARRRPQWRGPQ